MFERFTASARHVVEGAQGQARQLRAPYIGTEHLLLALLEPGAGVAQAVLHEAGVNADRVREDIHRVVGTVPGVLTDEDAAALRTIGIDLHAVLGRTAGVRLRGLGRRPSRPDRARRRRGRSSRGGRRARDRFLRLPVGARHPRRAVLSARDGRAARRAGRRRLHRRVGRSSGPARRQSEPSARHPAAQGPHLQRAAGNRGVHRAALRPLRPEPRRLRARSSSRLTRAAGPARPPRRRQPWRCRTRPRHR